MGLALDYGPDAKTIFAFVERHWKTIVEPRWEALGHRGQTYFIVMVPLVVWFARILPEIARILPEIAKKRRERANQKLACRRGRYGTRTASTLQTRQRPRLPALARRSGARPQMARRRTQALLAIPYEGQQLTLPL